MNKSTAMTFFGGGTAVVGGWTAHEIAAIGGFLVSAVGLLIMWYYKYKDSKLKYNYYKKLLSRTLNTDFDTDL